jgi:hypothetical protein
MSYGNIKQRTHDAAQPPQRSPLLCYADNCPCNGSTSSDGSRFLCSAHSCVPSEDWREVTEKLRNHGWLIAFTDDLLKVEKARKKNGPGWREYATEFWTGTDPACLPHERENMLPYQNRMRGELLYRCGLSKRPAVRLPQESKDRGPAFAWRQA